MEEQLCHYSSGAGTWELDQGTLCKAALSLSAEGLGGRRGRVIFQKNVVQKDESLHPEWKNSIVAAAVPWAEVREYHPVTSAVVQK